MESLRRLSVFTQAVEGPGESQIDMFTLNVALRYLKLILSILRSSALTLL